MKLYHGPLDHRCPQCTYNATGGGPSPFGERLLRCTGCHAVRYCSREHQVADRRSHKSPCKKIKAAREELAYKERILRQLSPDPFNHDDGIWRRDEDTGAYLDARHELAIATLLQEDTLDSVQETLKHAQDMLRLNPADARELRLFVPNLLLRLDRDQECYDFIKWWALYNPHNIIDFGTRPREQFLHLRDQDPLESPEFVLHDLAPPIVTHLSALLLLNVKMLSDIKNLAGADKARAFCARHVLPPEIWTNIDKHIVRSPLSVRFLELEEEELVLAASDISRNIARLAEALMARSPYFLPCLYNPMQAPRNVKEDPEAWADLVNDLHSSHPAWIEVKHALFTLDITLARSETWRNKPWSSTMNSNISPHPSVVEARARGGWDMF